MFPQVFLFLIILIKCHGYQSSCCYEYNRHRIPQDVMVDVVNNLALKLLAIHNEGNENNIAISPYGALSVLVALKEGVQGPAETEIYRASGIPSDLSVIRIGLRDIHRHLKSYFIPDEGFLSGMTFSHDNVTLSREYEDILRFYGFDINSFNNALYPDFSTTESVSTTTEVLSTTNEVITSTMEGVTSTLESVTSTTEGVTNTMEGMTSTIEGVTSTTEAATTPEKMSEKEENGELMSSTISTTNSATSTEVVTTTTGAATTTEEITEKEVNGELTSSTISTTNSEAATTEIVRITRSEAPTTAEVSTVGITETITTTETDIKTTVVTSTTVKDTTIAETTTATYGPTTPSSTETSKSESTTETMTTTDVTKEATEMSSIMSTELSTEMNSIMSTELSTELTTLVPSETTTENVITSSTTNSIESTTNPIELPDVTTDESTNNDTIRRNTRSVVDYIIARYYDDHVVTQRPPPYNSESDLYFLINGKYKETNINYMTYDTVLPFHYISHLNTLALRFPLDSSKYYLLLLLPENPEQINKLICDLRLNSNLKYITDNLRYTHVKAVIPSFMLKGYVVLTPTFQKMGINRVFEPRQANFSPMTNDRGIYVTNIEQAITVNIRNYVDPATMNNNRYLHQTKPVLFKADHPFLYFVIDSEIDVTLMAGKIVNPLNARIR